MLDGPTDGPMLEGANDALLADDTTSDDALAGIAEDNAEGDTLTGDGLNELGAMLRTELAEGSIENDDATSDDTLDGAGITEEGNALDGLGDNDEAINDDTPAETLGEILTDDKDGDGDDGETLGAAGLTDGLSDGLGEEGPLDSPLDDRNGDTLRLDSNDAEGEGDEIISDEEGDAILGELDETGAAEETLCTLLGAALDGALGLPLGALTELTDFAEETAGKLLDLADVGEEDAELTAAPAVTSGGVRHFGHSVTGACVAAAVPVSVPLFLFPL